MSSTPLRPSPTLPGPWAAVVFDMDGLLVHTERQWLQAKLELFRRHGQELSEADRASVFGLADLETATFFADRLGVPAREVPDLRAEYIEIVGELIDTEVEITAGATELLASLRGRVPIALASNTRRSLVDRILAQTPFGGWFGAIATGDEATPKPAPDVYLLACARIGADPAQGRRGRGLPGRRPRRAGGRPGLHRRAQR